MDRATREGTAKHNLKCLQLKSPGGTCQRDLGQGAYLRWLRCCQTSLRSGVQKPGHDLRVKLGDVLCNLSDVTSHYIVRGKRVAVAQYESLRSAMVKTMKHSGWVVH